MNAGDLLRSMLVMIAVAPFALGCAGPEDPSDPITERESALRVITDPGTTDPVDPPPTRPSRPTAAVPEYADLLASGSMRMLTAPNGGLEIWLNVRNVGNMEAKGPGTVTIGGYTASGPLSQYYGGPPVSGPNALAGGARGWITLDLPAGALVRCSAYIAHVDTGRVMQGATAGGPDVFANDEKRVKSPCLEWTTTISQDNDDFANSLINGKSLMEIVSSQAIGRADGKPCSECHYRDCGLAYHPPVDRFGSGLIWPTDDINGRTWAGPNGYARGFLQQPTDDPTQWNSKPTHLKGSLITWILDGERWTDTGVTRDPAPPLYGE
jgi:hypothetical protein